MSTARCRSSWPTRCRRRSTSIRKPVKGSRVHIVGVAYKRDVSDIRESPALEVIAALEQRGALLSYSDPFVPELKLHGLTLQSQDLTPAAAQSDCCVIITNHSGVDYAALLEAAPMVVDTRNALKSMRSDKIFRL